MLYFEIYRYTVCVYIYIHMVGICQEYPSKISNPKSHVITTVLCFYIEKSYISLLALFYHPKVWEYCRDDSAIHPLPLPPQITWLICIPPQSPMWPFPFVTWPVRALQLHSLISPLHWITAIRGLQWPDYQMRKAGILQISYPLINIPLFCSLSRTPPHPL